MKYCYVNNGSIEKGPMDLPQNWEFISNFCLLSNQELKSYGWYPYRLITVSIPTNCILTNSTFTITDTEVIEQQNYRQMTQQEIDIETQRLWISVRRTRNELLTSSDWTQIIDSPLSDPKRLEWKDYRQQLRDIPDVYTNPRDVVWPTQPS